MKKLMIAAAIVCAAVVSQAATYNWNVGTALDGELLKHSSKTKVSGVDMFIVNAADVTWDLSEAWDGLKAGTMTFAELTADAVYSDTLTDGALTYTKPAFSTEASNKNHTFYILVQDGDSYFLNEEKIAGLTTTAGKDFKYGYDWSGDKDYDFGNAASFTEGGWYTVPEPTSGLLLLLGVAGLALRRKQK